jgi:hypothetical protein
MPGQLADGSQDRDARGRRSEAVIAKLLGEVLGGRGHGANRTGRVDRVRTVEDRSSGLYSRSMTSLWPRTNEHRPVPAIAPRPPFVRVPA